MIEDALWILAISFFIAGTTIVIVAALYILVRVVSFAYFRTKLEYFRRLTKDLKERQ